MRYTIYHNINYQYDCPVQLDNHVLRLYPRTDVNQLVSNSAVQISPQPDKVVQTLDLDGNSVSILWFSAAESMTRLSVQVTSDVETLRTNPFDYLLERWATTLPLNYPSMLKMQLMPYLGINGSGLVSAIEPAAMQLAQEVLYATENNVVSFLSSLNQRIYEQCQYTIRETGHPLPPGITWGKKLGSCRDFAVLFMEACRAVGLAARFVSGYQEGDADTRDRHLHAWAEVYLPGAGWRGYDPTLGLAVGDRHVALVASAYPDYAAPLTGKLRAGTNAKATMGYQLSIKVND